MGKRESKEPLMEWEEPKAAQKALGRSYSKTVFSFRRNWMKAIQTRGWP